MRVLVTGGAGFIGSAVCRLLVGELNATVLNADKLTYAANLTSLRPIEGNPRYAFRRADICDRRAISDIFREFDPDAVLHLAAESHVDRSIDGPAAFIATNIEGTHVLLEIALAYWRQLPAKRAKRFRFSSKRGDESPSPGRSPAGPPNRPARAACVTCSGLRMDAASTCVLKP